mmetsp:Transcript_4710/g.9510  ORF Transcript_4710/g.9510 Transcript_4710/m.9510 type:complete len:151 (-) Transcript_4710:454-906(-)
MEEVKDWFRRPKAGQLDMLQREVKALEASLLVKDPKLHHHLIGLGIEFPLFARRWLQLWLTREFELPEAIVLWDSILASGVRLPWLRYLCLGMLSLQRDALLASSSQGVLNLLLHYPSTEPRFLVRVADQLRSGSIFDNCVVDKKLPSIK